MTIAIVVRNAMEDFHCQHLSDEQLRELNPFIRNAIYTALHAQEYRDGENAAASFVVHQQRMIPGYWEPPQLMESYVRMLDRESQE